MDSAVQTVAHLSLVVCVVEVDTSLFRSPLVHIAGAWLDGILGNTRNTVGPWRAVLSDAVEVDAGHVVEVVDDGKVNTVADLELQGRTWQCAVGQDSFSGCANVRVGGAP